MHSINDNIVSMEKYANTDQNEDTPNTELHSVWNKNLSGEDHQILESAMKFFVKISAGARTGT